MFGMHPELINQIETDNGEQDFPRIASGEEREIENETVKVRAGLTEGRTKIEIFTLMMRDMGAPEQRDFMPPSVFPVVRQIVKHKTG